MNFFSTWKRVLKNAAISWSNDRCSTLGAALSYYTLFSLAPLLLITIGIIGIVFGADSARTGVIDQLRETAGTQTAEAIDSILKGAGKAGGTTLTVFGIVLLLFGAIGVFVELQDALNQIWRTSRPRASGIWGWVCIRLLALGAVFTTGLLLLASLTVSSMVEGVSSQVEKMWELPGGAGLWRGVSLGVTFAFVVLLCALVFRFLPNTRVTWSDVWGGALLTGVLFGLGKYLFSIYLGHVAVTSMYGAAGSVVLVLVWVYYSTQILLFGAEVTHAYAKEAGSLKGVPEEGPCPPAAAAQPPEQKRVPASSRQPA
jgi:membrane protein